MSRVMISYQRYGNDAEQDYGEEYDDELEADEYDETDESDSESDWEN